MLSLKERVRSLEEDINANPPRHYIYRDLPFAVFCYPPHQEWTMRREIILLKTRIEQEKRWRVTIISLADLLWQSIDETEGMQAIIDLEKRRDFSTVQAQVYEYLTDPDWRPMADLLTERLSALDPQKDLVFLTRVGSLAPEMYRVSTLLDHMKGKTSVSCILFMPATSGDGEGLRFMGLSDIEPRGSYHTKLYLG